MSKPEVTMTFECLSHDEKALLLEYLVKWNAWAKARKGDVLAFDEGATKPYACRVVGLCLNSPVELYPVFKEQGRDPFFPFNAGSPARYRAMSDCRKSRSRRKWVRDAIAALREDLA